MASSSPVGGTGTAPSQASKRRRTRVSFGHGVSSNRLLRPYTPGSSRRAKFGERFDAYQSSSESPKRILKPANWRAVGARWARKVCGDSFEERKSGISRPRDDPPEAEAGSSRKFV